MITSKIKAEFNAPVEKVWHAVTDFAASGWRSDIAKTEVKDKTHFVEYTAKGFATYFTITEKRDCELLKLEIKNKNIVGTWTGIFRPTEKGAEIEFTEEAEVSNLFMRIFAKSFFKKQQKRYMKDLKKYLLK